VRNRLAHRILIEQRDGADDRVRKQELLAIGALFKASIDELMATSVFQDRVYRGPVPEYWRPVAERIIAWAFGGGPIPRDPNNQ
jgi:hypothetical protein